MKPWTLISYYTRGTGYEAEARKLIASCDRLGVRHAVAAVNSRGSWQANTQMKAEIILQALNVTGADDNLVFVDADAIVREYPVLFDTLDADLGLSFRNYALFPCGSRRAGKELLSGTIYLARRPVVSELIREWISENHKNPQAWDQRTLQAVVERNRSTLAIAELPPTYCKIFDLMRAAGPGVIEHYQKSRLYRSKVGNRPIRLQTNPVGRMLQTSDLH